MFNYARAEMYRLTKRKGYYLLLLLGIVSLIFIVVAARSQASSIPVEEFYMAIIMITTVLAPVFPNIIENLIHKSRGVQSNLVPIGVKKERIYFGDFFMTILVMAITVGLFFLVIIGLAATFFTGFQFDSSLLKLVEYICFAFIMCLPLVAFSLILNVVFNKAMATTMYYFFNYLFVSILGMIEAVTDKDWIRIIAKNPPTVHLMKKAQNFEGLGWAHCSEAYISAAVLLVVFLGLGFLIYKKKEL